MRLIINSYLKTFLKNWVSTVGILLFIIMLGAVVLGMMTTPLQLSVHINAVERQTTKYDYQVKDGKKYSDDFSYHYFLLNGEKYTQETEKTTILQPTENFEMIAPNQLQSFIQSLRNNQNLDQPTYLSKASYLLIDEAMASVINNSRVPEDLEGLDWTEILDPNLLTENPNLSPQARQYITDLLANVANLVNVLIYAGQESANQNLNASVTLPEDNKDNIINLVINDLKKNLQIQDYNHDAYFSKPQQLYIANNFLRINLGSQYTPITELDELTNDKFAELNAITLTGIMTLGANFRELMVDHQNSVNAYLLDNIFHNPKNKNAVDSNQQLAFSLASSIDYSLIRSKPGLLTPDFSVDIRTVAAEQNFNQLILETGSLPSWDKDDRNAIPEVVLSSGFMKLNNLKNGDLITLPGSSFGQNINRTADPASWIAANDTQVRIVGTGSRYDELTPGSGYTSFVQEFDTYTYAYLPASFTGTYKKASFVYGAVNARNYTPNVAFRIKNQTRSNLSPKSAFDIDFARSETIFGDSSTLVTNIKDLSTILSLNNINIQVIIYNVLGLIALVLAFIFINFIIKKEINETRRQLGIFKSFGYKTSELSLIFAIKTLITILIGMIIGWLCSFPVQIYMGTNFESSVVFSYQSIYFNPILIVGVFLLVPGFFMLISYLITLKYLSESALSLISNGNRIAKHMPKMSWVSRQMLKKGKGFNYRLRRSFVNRSKGKFTVVQVLFGVSALLYTLMFGAQALMYQAIEQGFAVLADGTDHEYQWQNRHELIINQTTDGKFSMSGLESYDDNKIEYIDYQDYANPNQAMLNDAQLQATFSDARYRFRILTDALANSIVDKSQGNDPSNWVLLPTQIAEEKFASDASSSNNSLLETKYFMYKLLIFKGLNLEEKNNDFNYLVEQSILNNQPYQGTLNDLIRETEKGNTWMTAWNLLQISQNLPGAKEVLAQTLFGMTDVNSENLTNNLFLTDLSRIIAMFFAEQYATNRLAQILRASWEPDDNGKYLKTQVDESLKKLYQEVLTDRNSLLYRFDPRNEIYWNVLNNPLLDLNLGFATDEESGFSDLLNNLSPSLLGILTSAMLAESRPDLKNEAVLNFNKFFYDSQKEHLQLLLDVLSTPDYDVGSMYLDLVDTQEPHVFGDPRNQFNFDGVSASEYQKLSETLDEPNTFNTIIPYAIAQKLKLKKGDTLEVVTSTQSKETIKLVVVGINKAMTMPVSLSWVIMVDYHVFAEKMFTDELKTKIGLNEPGISHSYLFNSLLSQNPMLSGTFDIKNLPESLKSFKFAGDQLTINADKDAAVLGSMLGELIGGTDLGGSLEKINFQVDEEMSLITNPMMINADKTKLVAMPYNIARVGVYNFTSLMTQIMIIFLLLLSVLLTIILVVIMNIVVDEFAVTILTLRSLGYLPREINWIVMGSYVIGTIISFALAYALSLILWKIFLIVVANLWQIYVFLPFDWKSLVIPILVLSSIMFVGWMASNYQVNRRSLIQITNFA